jgi:hypothetical protein
MPTQNSFKLLRAMFDVDLALLINEEAQEFYRANRHTDVSTLLFRYADHKLNRLRSIQLEARKKAAGKIPAWSAVSEIIFPPKHFLEQASSEQTAKYKARLFPYKSSVDLTGGTGIDSWQIALHGSNHVYVEQHAELVRLARHNFKQLGLDRISIQHKKAEDYIIELNEPVDLIYLDPLRRKDGKRKILITDYSPNVHDFLDALMAQAKHVIIKVSPLVDLSYLAKSFHPYVSDMHVVAVWNECKEVLVHLTANGSSEPEIIAANLLENQAQLFSFKRSEEQQIPAYTNQLHAYLYEPNAAVMKAGAFNSVAKRFKLFKLHANSHLYTSEEVRIDFPGNCYKVVEQAPPYKLVRSYQGVAIATRNFPQTVKTIRKKTGFSDGNEFKLFATTVGLKKMFVIGQKLVD